MSSPYNFHFSQPKSEVRKIEDFSHLQMKNSAISHLKSNQSKSKKKQKLFDSGRTRTYNLLLRRQAPYPLGHRALHLLKSLLSRQRFQLKIRFLYELNYCLLGQNCFWALVSKVIQAEIMNVKLISKMSIQTSSSNSFPN